MEEQALQVVVADWTANTGEKGMFARPREAAYRVAEIGAENMAAQTRQICQYLGAVFADAATAVEGLELDTLEVKVEVTASGELRLIGGVSTGVTGGLTLTFKRMQP